MKVVILAAGKGTRLRPLTDNMPKCMVIVNEKPIIEHQLNLFNKLNLTDITVVTGYKNDKIQFSNINKILNQQYDTTNMVHTFFCAQYLMRDEDILISYGDIIYDKKILNNVINDNSDISVAIDMDWYELWSRRMDDPLSDAETLKLDKSDFITEIGKKPKSYEEIEGQYIGLIKIKKRILSKVINFYHSLDKKILYDGHDFNNMYMTSFLQLIIDNLLPIKAVKVYGGWVEIDNMEDLQVAKDILK